VNASTCVLLPIDVVDLLAPANYRLLGFGVVVKHSTGLPISGSFYFGLYANSSTGQSASGSLLTSATLSEFVFAPDNSFGGYTVATRHTILLPQPFIVTVGRWWIALCADSLVNLYATLGGSSAPMYMAPTNSGGLPPDASAFSSAGQNTVSLYAVMNNTVQNGYTTPPVDTTSPPPQPNNGWPVWAIVVIVILIILIVAVVVALLVYIICFCCCEESEDPYVLELNALHKPPSRG